MEVVDIFENIVQGVNDNNSFNDVIEYQHGHLMEINQTLTQKDQDPINYKKYPLIMLVPPFDQVNENGHVYVNDLRLIICTSTQSDIKAEERYNTTFKPVLIPIYNAFIDEIVKSGYFFFSDGELTPPHTRIDRPFYGVSSQNGNIRYVMNDKLDAIEITDLNVNYLNNKC